MFLQQNSTSKNILLVLPEAFDCAGGIQMFCRALCLALGRRAQNNGAYVSALVLNDSTLDKRYVNGGFASFVGAGRSKTKFIRHYLSHLLTNQYDWIVFGHVYLSPLMLIPKFFRSHVKVAVITYGKEVWQPLTKLQQRAMHHTDVVLSISDHTRGEVIRHGRIPPEKIKILPCPLDPYWSLVSLPAKFESKPPVILTVARLSRQDTHKGIDSVIRSLPNVIDRLGPIEYRIVGEGDDVPRLQALALEMGLSEHVKFLGGVPESELHEHYRSCSLFVLPSAQEGFGIVFLEAMAYGKPVIGGLHGGTPFVVKDKQTGWLVDWADVATISATIVMFLRDEALRESVGLAGYHRLLEQFTFKKFEATLETILSTATA